MTVKFEFCSDLHDNAWRRAIQRQVKVVIPGLPHVTSSHVGSTVDWAYHKQEDTRVLVIAGDISDDLKTSLDIVKDAAAVYEFVVFVEGNHDHWEGDQTITNNTQKIRDELSCHPNVIFLDGMSTFTIEGTRFIGAMGWYDWKGYEHLGITQEVARQAWLDLENDSYWPQYGELKDPATLAFIHAEAVRQQVIDANADDEVQSIVVVTHTVPRHELLVWKEGDNVWNHLSPSYMNGQMATSLAADTGQKIKVWIYGHTHFRDMKEIDGVTYCNNARGYPGESSPWWLPQVEV
jgi:predicted phosphodiesterase